MSLAPEKKMSEFELRMAQRRAATENSLLSQSGLDSSTMSTTSQSSRVAELASKFGAKSTPALSPSSVNSSFVAANASPSGSSNGSFIAPKPASSSVTASSVAPSLNRLNRSGSSPAQSSGTSELAEKLKARKEASGEVPNAGTAAANLSALGTSSPASALLARVNAKPGHTASTGAGTTPSPANPSSAVLNKGPASTVKVVEKSQDRSMLSEALSEIETSTSGVNASAVNTSTSSVRSSEAELASKLSARRQVVDAKGTVTTAENLAAAAMRLSESPSSSQRASAGMSVRPHSSFDSPRSLSKLDESAIPRVSDEVVADFQEPEAIPISPTAEEYKAQAKIVWSPIESDEPLANATIDRAPLAPFETRVSFFDGLLQEAAASRAQEEATTSILRSKRRVPGRRREIVIGSPYVPNYIPEEPLSDERSDSRIWTLVYAYMLPLVLLAVLHSMQTTADSRFFASLPSSAALVEPFPSTRTNPTAWTPAGIRRSVVGPGTERATVPLRKATRTSRATDARDGYVWISAGPRFESSWGAESRSLIHGTGLALDDWGSVFLCPVYTGAEDGDADVSMIALDASTGERRWTWSNPVVSSGFFSSSPAEPPVVRAGCGAPLVLNDPSLPLERRTAQIVYHSTRLKAVAVRSHDGSQVWTAQTGVPPVLSAEHEDKESEEAKQAEFAASKMWGFSYVSSLDALVSITNDGYVFALDRTTGTQIAETKRLPCALPRTPQSQPAGWSRFEAAFPGVRHIPVQCVLSSLSTADDPSSARLFVAATAKADGSDGLTDKAALYSIEIVPGEADSKFPRRIRFAHSVLVGDAIADLGAPVVSASGKIVFVGDRTIAGVRFLHAENLTEMLAVGGLGEGVPSISLAEDEEGGALYVKMDTAIIKVAIGSSEGSGEDSIPLAAQVAWTQSFGETQLPVGLEMRPATAVSIVGNGLVVAAHVCVGDRPYPAHRGTILSSGVVMLDRLSGEIRSSWITSEGEAVSDMAVGMDGSVFLVKNPLARSPAIDVFGESAVPFLSGGLARFKPLNYLELARDASCASFERIKNAMSFRGGWLSSLPPGAEEASRDDARQVAALAWQAVAAFNIFASGGHAKALPNVVLLQTNFDALGESVSSGAPLPPSLESKGAFALMTSVQPYVEAVCKELSAL